MRLIKFEELNGLLDLYKYLNPDDPDLKGTDCINKQWKKFTMIQTYIILWWKMTG